MEQADSAALLRLVHQAMRRAGLLAEDVLLQVGVGLSGMAEQRRTPLHAQQVFWQAVQARSMVTKSDGYLTNGAAAQGDVQTQRHFGGCLLVGMICFCQVRHRGAL